MNARLGLMLTPREAANILGVDASTVAKWAHDANLAHQVGEGGKRRYPESEILWLRDSQLRKRVPDSATYENKSAFAPSVKRAQDAFDSALAQAPDKRHKAEYKFWLTEVADLADAMAAEVARLEYERGFSDAVTFGDDRRPRVVERRGM